MQISQVSHSRPYWRVDLSKLNYAFMSKPLVVGGKAMEYYGLRKAGDDIDLVVPARDVEQLIRQFPDRVKDLWGDLGVCPYEFEIWKTICMLDYDYLSEGAIDTGNVLIISIEKLLLMKALAMHKEKYLEDTKLVIKRILDGQVEKYSKLAAENKHLLTGVAGIRYLEKTGPKATQH